MALIGTISGSNGTSTTAISGSVIIADRPPGEFPSLPPNAKFYVSGTRDVNGPLGAIAIFGGDTFVTGGLGVSDYVQMLPVNELRIPTNTSASYIYTSGSTNDMYFTQYTGPYTNTTRLRWLESSLSSGLLHGGILSTQNGTTTFSITSGSGIIVYQNATTSSDPYPTIKFVNWPAYVSQSLQYSGSAQITYIAIDPDGDIDQSPIAFNTEQFKDRIVLGRILHQSGSVSNGATNTPTTAYAVSQNTNDFVRAFGPLKISGHFLSASGSAPTLSIVKTAGSSYVEGRNYTIDPNNPNIINASTDPDVTVSKIYREYVSGSTPIIDTGIANAGYAVLDPSLYNNNGTLASVGNGEYSIQRVFWFPRAVNRALFVYYGSAKYPTMDDAVAGITTENFIEGGNTAGSAILVGYICIKGNASDLLNALDAKIFQGGLFRGSSGASFGGASGGASLPGGLDTYVQFNDDNTFGGESGFTFNKLTNSATLVGDINAANANLSGNVNAAIASITGNSYTSGTLYAKDVFIFGNLTVTSGSTVISGSGVSIQGGGTGNVNIATDAFATPVNIANNTVAGTVNIGTGSATQTLNFGTGIGVKTVSVGSINTTSTTNVSGGTGGINITTDGVAGNINVINTSTGILNLFNDTGTGAVNIVGSSATGVRAVNIGTGGTGAKTVTIGSNVLGSITTIDANDALYLGTGTGYPYINIGGSTTGQQNINVGRAGGATGIQNIFIGNTGAATNSVSISAGTTGGIGIGTDAVATPVNIANNTTAGTVNVGTGSATQTLNFGTGAGAKTVSIGSSTGASSLSLQSGTGALNVGTAATSKSIQIGTTVNTSLLNMIGGSGGVQVTVGATAGAITLTGTSTGLINIGNDTGSGTISIGSSTGARQINVGTGSATQTLNFGTGTGVKTNTLGSTNTTSTTTINGGTGGVNIATAAAATPVNIATSTTAGTVSIGTGTATQTLNFGTGTGVKTVSVGSINTTSTTNVSGGTGGINITTDGVAGNINVINTSTGNLNLFNDTGTGNVNIVGSSATGVRTVNIGTGGTGTKTINIGSVAVAESSVSIFGGGTGGVNIATTAATTPVNIANNTTAGTVNIGTGSATQTLNFGTGVGAKTVSIGSTNSSSTLSLNAGSGAMTLTAVGAFDVNAATAVTIDSSGGSISIGSDSVSQTINLGTAGNRSINIGSFSSTGNIDLRGGFRGILIGIGATQGTRGIGYFSYNRSGGAYTDGTLLAFQASPAADNAQPQLILASAASGSLSSIKWVNGISCNNASVANDGQGNVCTVAGTITPVKFETGGDPAGPTDIGRRVYLSPVAAQAGKATLLQPSGSGERVFQVGILARGVSDANSNWFVQFVPQFIEDIP